MQESRWKLEKLEKMKAAIKYARLVEHFSVIMGCLQKNKKSTMLTLMPLYPPLHYLVQFFLELYPFCFILNGNLLLFVAQLIIQQHFTVSSVNQNNL